MADIQLRFAKDMLVLSSPVTESQKGLSGSAFGISSGSEGSSMSKIVSAELDAETAFKLLMEPEVIEQAYNLQSVSGAQCMVLPTSFMTSARLSHTGFKEDAVQLVEAALEIVKGVNPQHILAEIGPCGLPLDPSSASSLKENRDQYAKAAELFEGSGIDAIFLNGFERVADLKCALMGVRKVSDVPIFSSVNASMSADGAWIIDRGHASGEGEALSLAFDTMSEYGSQVLGIQTSEPLEETCKLVADLRERSHLPILVQLEVLAHDIGSAEDEDLSFAADDDASEYEKAISERRFQDASKIVSSAQLNPFNTDIALEAANPSAFLSKLEEISPRGLPREESISSPYSEPEDMLDAASRLRDAGTQFLRATGNASIAYTATLVAATEGLDVVVPPYEREESSSESSLAAVKHSAEELDELASVLRARLKSAMDSRARGGE